MSKDIYYKNESIKSRKEFEEHLASDEVKNADREVDEEVKRMGGKIAASLSLQLIQVAEPTDDKDTAVTAKVMGGRQDLMKMLTSLLEEEPDMKDIIKMAVIQTLIMARVDRHEIRNQEHATSQIMQLMKELEIGEKTFDQMKINFQDTALEKKPIPMGGKVHES